MLRILIPLLVSIGILYLVIWFIKLIIRSATNMPTWQGIIISAILGMLPFYLFLCFFGLMGEERNMYSTDDLYHHGSDNDSKFKKNRSWIKYLILVLFIFFLLIFSINYFISDTLTRSPIVQPTSNQVDIERQEEKLKVEKKQTNAKRKKNKKEKEKPSVKPLGNIAVDSPQSKESHVESSYDKEIERQKSTLELIEEQNHASVVKQAKEAGVSTEGSTLDILDRINHASVVKRAKEAGVSTEGSTLDILDRINHASVVKRAKEAGISAEGSTLDILDRINHASVVKRAKEAGVSTEGSTLEILDRINRKQLEENK